MEIFLSIAGVYGGPISGVTVKMSNLRKIPVDDLLRDLGLQAPPEGVKFGAWAFPCPEEQEEKVELRKPVYGCESVLAGSALGSLFCLQSSDPENRWTVLDRLPDGRKEWNLSYDEARALMEKYYPSVPFGEKISEETPLFWNFAPYGNAVTIWGDYDLGRELGLPPAPWAVKGIIDINRFLIPGKTKFGVIEPTHLIYERVTWGLNGFVFSEDGYAYLYDPGARARRAGDKGPKETHGAVILKNTAFDIK